MPRLKAIVASLLLTGTLFAAAAAAPTAAQAAPYCGARWHHRVVYHGRWVGYHHWDRGHHRWHR